ncbi:DEAD/DEAH box helicase [Streptomyces sp. P17]|nr:DEAD/DEAH box helicase [Streptomyces sp. P17]
MRLTGEAAVDTELIRAADVWVATTEKFEAICRAGSLRDALAEVGCLVVDEIHLLGDPARGAVLEALLARVREDGTGTRIVGLSATVANADEVAVPHRVGLSARRRRRGPPGSEPAGRRPWLGAYRAMRR